MNILEGMEIYKEKHINDLMNVQKINSRLPYSCRGRENLPLQLPRKETSSNQNLTTTVQLRKQKTKQLST